MALFSQLVRGAALTACVLFAALPARAAEDLPDLPKQMTWTAYGTTASGYAMAVGIGNALKDAYGVNFRVIPGENDIARMAPLRDGKAEACACGIASYFGVEGVQFFADPEWGPQPVRLLLYSKGENGLMAVAANDVGIKTIADFKGKKMPWVKGSDALNLGLEAMMAFGGVTWDDVTKVEVPGNKQMFEAMLAGQVDAAFTSTVNPDTQKVAASPRGIIWPAMDPADEAGWGRVREVGPWFQPHKVTQGTEISQEKPVPGATYPYPIIVVNDTMSDAAAYAVVKAMDKTYDQYKTANPGAYGFKLEEQDFQWVIPVHPGAARYFKERGVWSDADEQHNQKLLERVQLIRSTWEQFTKDAPSDKEAFATAWMAARAKALTDAGFTVVFK